MRMFGMLSGVFGDYQMEYGESLTNIFAIKFNFLCKNTAKCTKKLLIHTILSLSINFNPFQTTFHQVFPLHEPNFPSTVQGVSVKSPKETS